MEIIEKVGMCTKRNNMQPLVSIIVPVFNTGKYLSECLNSIICQNYPSIEIIVVNDGSTDNSSSICDYFASKESFISVIHKTNGGLSSARNAGLCVAEGDYITFIDSDDYYLSCDTISKLVGLVLNYDVDIACCNYTSNHEHIERNHDENIEIYDKETAISQLFDDHGIRCFSCNKIFKREIFSDITFPEGKAFEDILTMYQIMDKVNKIAFYNRKLYFYRKRLNSITVSAFSKKNYDLLEAIRKVLDNSNIKHPRAYERLKVGYSYYYLVFINKAFVSGVPIKKNVDELREHIRTNYRDILKSDCLRIVRKWMVIIFGVSPFVYKALYIPIFRLFTLFYYEKE